MATALLARALERGIDPPADATSERILDAALGLCAASGVRHLTMDDVAARAGVGRMTVYRRFGEREGLVAALAAREARTAIAELDAATRVTDPIDEQIAGGFVASLRIARRHPLLARLVGTEPEAVLGALLAHDAAVFGLARAYLAQRLREAQLAGVLGPGDVELPAELLVRLALSFVLIGATRLPLDDEKRLQMIAVTTIAPMLGQLRPGAAGPG